MKLKNILMPVVLLAILIAGVFAFVKGSHDNQSKTRIELSDSQNKSDDMIAEAPVQVQLEHKEAYKVDDGEYVSAVATKSSFGSMFTVIGLGGVALIMSLFFRNIKQKIASINPVVLRLAIASLFIVAVGKFAPLTAMLLAGIAMAFPNPKWIKGRLTVGAQTEEQKALLEQIQLKTKEQIEGFKSELVKLANDAKTGMIDKETFDAKFKETGLKLQAFDGEKFQLFEKTLNEYKTKLEEQMAAMKVQSETIKKLSESGADGNNKAITPLRAELKKFLASEDWKSFVESDGKKKVSFKAPVSITSDYTGTSRVHITTRDGRVVDHPQVTRLNIRDLLTVSPTDLPYLAFIEVYNWTRASATLTENGSLPESAFQVREATADVKRIGTSMPISKRMLRSSAFIENHLVNRLPAQVRFFEDFQLLFGDGAGNNPTGIFKVASTFDSIVNAPITGLAGAVTSVATYDAGAKTIVTFTAAQNINNGDTITFAAATAGGYNASFSALVIGPKQILIETAYVAEADTSAWTFTVASRFKQSIPAAQEIDVLKVAKTLVTRQEYSANGIVMHPDDATVIETLKGNDEHYIDVKRLESGILTIAGVPVVETTAMPSGKFAIGDWALAAALLEFTSLILEFSESTNEKLTNSVMAIIHEEIIFPIYNRYMFVVGDFASAKTAINKP